MDDLDLTENIGTDEQGQFIDFVIFGYPRKRDYVDGKGVKRGEVMRQRGSRRKDVDADRDNMTAGL